MRFSSAAAMCVLLLAGCAGAVSSNVTVVPPKPVATAAEKPTEPAPVAPKPPADADGDGIAEGDRCPDAKETDNGYQDDDGCPDELPDVHLAGHEIRVKRPIAFSSLGLLKDDNKALLDGVAKVMSDNADIESLEVGGHLWGGRSFDKRGASEARAKSVRDALAKRGVAAARLSAVGYGDKCPAPAEATAAEERVRIDLKVVKRAGEDTGVARGCAK